MFRRFLEARDGSVAPIFAIALLPMVAATGAAVDYSLAFQQRTVVQNALDAASLAANRKIGAGTEAQIKQEAENFYLANIGDKLTDPPDFDMDLDGGSVLLTTELSVPTSFLGVMGFNEIVFDIRSRTVAGAATYEIVMVLDNSGSMQGSKISSLRTAAKDLVDIMFEVNASNPKTDPVKIGLVPFAASVNIGDKYENASWMDQNGLSSIHYEDFEDDGMTRWEAFDALKNTSWAGCVQARPKPYDVTDDVPSTGTPDTLFVPMFAVDEPDDSDFHNSYLDDDGGSCPSSSGGKGKKKKFKSGGSSSNLSEEELQARMCKYDNEQPKGGNGPNWNCTTQEVQELTTSQHTIKQQINGMQANGMTNIHGGLMWGWRLLSPTLPFTEGRAYDEKDNRKILIVMTDGANTYTGYDNFNKSMYGAFGYISHDHLDTTSSSQSKIVEKMDERTALACKNIKATGKITIYTIAFKVSDDDTLKMLEDCASEKTMAFASSNNTELVETFNQIATEISLLRISE